MAVTIKPARVTALTPEMYAALRKSFGGISIGNETTPQQVGFMLGVQAVLEKLREGFVHGN